MLWQGVSFLAFLCVPSSAAPPAQVPLAEDKAGTEPPKILESAEKDRPLHGRFLHITDFHPDPFYEIYSSTSEDAACHSGQGPAGIYGAETSECDSPFSLVNETMAWIAKNVKDKVDFVIWTGDSARHDNDDNHPRNHDQVLNLNKFLVSKMAEVFGKHNGDEEDDDPNNDFIIPIVPNIGNNDILPHNILAKGPNEWTRTYAKVWRQFIPEVQKHQFEQGGWYYVEVIPNKLAVFSLNTIYFFSSNSLVDGCASHSEPGYQQMEWLRIQLQFMRERGMKAILIGHVPPVRQDAKTSWDETCWQKYTLWTRQYRDVLQSAHYGHFNYDHFMFQDFAKLDKDTKNGFMKYYHTEREEEPEDFSTQVSKNYWLQLRDEWSQLPEEPKTMNWLDIITGRRNREEEYRKYLKQIGGKYAERFSATFVSASVVPNLYPTLRIFEYNITGIDSHHVDRAVPDPAPFHPSEQIKKKKSHKFKVPEPPSKSAPPGPAYSPQMLSLMKYTQYYANLTVINNDFTSGSSSDNVGDLKWHEGKHKGKKPHEKDHKPNPKKFKFEVLYDTQDDKVYKLKDLTMPSIIGLARRIGNFVSEDEAVASVEGDIEMEKKKKKKHRKGKSSRKHSKENEAWYTFVSRAFVGTVDREDLEDDFGH